MHIPDGFLDAKTAAATAVLAAVGVGVAIVRGRKTVPPARVPVLGLSAAFLFAAQMINFPVAGGTSGHLMGAVLAAVLLRPSGAVIALTSVLTVQALLFADGGLLALGANILNMAVTAPLLGYAVYRVVSRLIPGERGHLTAAGFAAWCSMLAASAICAGELAWSGTVPWQAGFPAMAGIHAVIGLGEAIITMLVVGAIGRVRPDLLGAGDPVPRSRLSVLAYAGLVTLVLALFVAPFASPWPDGLERVAASLGFSGRALAHPLSSSPLAEYSIAGIQTPRLAAGLAGAAGTLIVLVVTYVVAALLVRRSSNRG